MKLGRHVLGAAAILLGAIALKWDDFAAVWQPVPATTPGRPLLAYVVGALFLVAGVAIQWRRAARPAAVTLGALFVVFGLLWLPRVVAMPTVFATWGGVAEQWAMALGALAVLACVQAGAGSARLVTAARLGFGVCAIMFGFNHFFALKETAAMVPKALPPSQMSWAMATGAFHVLGGLALLANVRAVLAAQLLTVMYAGFGVLVWAPLLTGQPGAHMIWCGNAVNLTLVGAAWALADALAEVRRR